MLVRVYHGFNHQFTDPKFRCVFHRRGTARVDAGALWSGTTIVNWKSHAGPGPGNPAVGLVVKWSSNWRGPCWLSIRCLNEVTLERWQVVKWWVDLWGIFQVFSNSDFSCQPTDLGWLQGLQAATTGGRVIAWSLNVQTWFVVCHNH